MDVLILKAIEYFTSVTRPAVTSISAAGAGTLLSVTTTSKPMIEIILQYSAWGVAILAGLLAIINSIISIKKGLKK
jgi:hypothetical protein